MWRMRLAGSASQAEEGLVAAVRARGVVGDDHRAFAQARADQRQRRDHHLGPDVEQDEVDRAAHVLQRLAQVALAQIDELGEAGGGEILPGGGGLRGLVLCADHHPAAVVAHRSRQIEGRDAERGAAFHHAAGHERAAGQVAELGLGGLQRHQLVGHEAVRLVIEAVPGELALLGPL